jgi:hypothetical protein
MIAARCVPVRPSAITRSPETRIGWLRQAFGPEADAEQLRLRVQFFHGRISDALPLH